MSTAAAPAPISTTVNTEELANSYDLEAADDDTALEPTKPEVPAVPPPAVPPVAAKPKHNPRLLAEAEEYGMDMKAVGLMTAEQLDENLHGIRLWLARERKAAIAADTRTGARPAEKPAPTVEPDALTGDEDLDPDFDPRLIAMQKKNRELAARLEKIEGNVASVNRVVQSSRDETIDGVFAKLNEKFGDIFGNGTYAELTEAGDRKSLMRRLATFKTAGVDFDKHSPKKIEQLLTEAAETLYDAPAPKVQAPAAAGSLYEAAAAGSQPRTDKGQFKIDTDKWNNAGLAKPTARTEAGPKVPGKKLAIENLGAAMAEMKGEVEGSGQVSKDDFLD